MDGSSAERAREQLVTALHQTATGDRSALQHGPIRIDRARHSVSVRGAPVSLTPKEFTILEMLTQAGGRVLTHAAILEHVWGKAHLNDVDYLRVAIRALRLKIEEDPAAPRLIRNEPAIGYRLADQD